MTSPEVSCKSATPQYHHFIPQFILRNFSHPYRPLGGRKGRRDKDTGLYPGEKVLNTIALDKDKPALIEAPIRRTFGLTDMYRDFVRTSDQQYLEKELGKLESKVGHIVTHINKSLSAGQAEVWLTRPERDTLRKFLFIMKYRGKGFHNRFSGATAEDYNADDKKEFLEYMQSAGYDKPLDVWFHSIKVILELKMDVKGDWQKELLTLMYPGDAVGFILHMEWSYLALCIPSTSDTQFLLTENCYSVHEGPVSTVLDPTSGKLVECWTAYHEFAPISPTLIMVLRSALLPNIDEDKNPVIRKEREILLRLSQNCHVDPSKARSILEDLPVTKPRNSYSLIDQNGIQLLQGEDGSRRSSHRFCFSFFKLKVQHVQMINSILLENAHAYSAIAYCSQRALIKTLEFYITLPTDRGLKRVGMEVNDTRLPYLRKLQRVLQMLGSSKDLVYEQAPPLGELSQKYAKIEQELLNSLPEHTNSFLVLYAKLGGKPSDLFRDMDQTRKMIWLRIKIDVWTQGVDEEVRRQIRENLGHLFCSCIPIRRLWLYEKQTRVMELRQPRLWRTSEPTPSVPADLIGDMGELFDGPEDIIAQARHIIRPQSIAWLMHMTVRMEVFRHKHLEMSSLDHPNFLEWFKAGGSISSCGIPRIEEVAATIVDKLLREEAKLPNTPLKQSLIRVEVGVRTIVGENFDVLMAGEADVNLLRELKEVLFTVLYPLWPADAE